jgi:regulator of replication initiation timing
MTSINNIASTLASSATTTAAAAGTPAAPAADVDINSLLTQLRAVEGDRENLLQQIQAMQEKIGKLTEGKKAEMQKALDTVINDWLQASVSDEKVRDEFKKGMSRLVDQTAEESGVWQVVCCASNVHAERLREIENMRIEMENLKKAQIGQFSDENSRKRARDESEPVKESKNIWEEFADNLKGYQFDPNM